MHRLVKLLPSAFLLICAISAAHAANYQNRNIRFGYGLTADSPEGRAVAFFSDDLAKRTGGKIKVKAVGSAGLGSDIDMQNALIGGTQEMTVVTTATLVGVVDDFGAFDLPFIFKNEEEADAILDGPFGERVTKKLEEKGLVGLAFWENGFRNLTNSKRPINKMEDLHGITLRVMQNPMYIDMFKGFGVNTVPLSFSNLFSAMKSGTVDGEENPVNTILTSKFYEVQKYLSITKHVYSPFIVLASKKWWDNLSADEKDAIQKSAVASKNFERKDSRETATKSIEMLKEKGMQVTVIPENELDRMRDTTRQAIFKFANDGHIKLIKDLQSRLEKMRK